MSALHPPIASKPCRCGQRVRVASDLDGNRVLLDVAPSARGTFLTIVAWNAQTIYVGEPDPREFIPQRERFAKHVHAAKAAAA